MVNEGKKKVGRELTIKEKGMVSKIGDSMTGSMKTGRGEGTGCARNR